MKSDSVLDKLVDRERRRGTLLYEGAIPLSLSPVLSLSLSISNLLARDGSSAGSDFATLGGS